MRDKQMRYNSTLGTNQNEPPLDAETLRLSNLQLAFLDLVGVHMGPNQRRALASAARLRLAEDESHRD